MSKSQYDFFVRIVFYFCHLIFPWVMFTKLDADFTGCPRSVVAHTEITWKLYSLQVQYNTGLKSADIIKGVLYSSVYGYDTDPKHCKEAQIDQIYVGALHPTHRPRSSPIHLLLLALFLFELNFFKVSSAVWPTPQTKRRVANENSSLVP